MQPGRIKLKSHLENDASVQYVISVQRYTHSVKDNHSDHSDGRKSKGEGLITQFAVLVTKSAPFPAGAHSVRAAHTYINASHVCPAERDNVHNVNAIRSRNMSVNARWDKDGRATETRDRRASERALAPRLVYGPSSSDNGSRKTGRTRNGVSLIQARERIYGSYRRYKNKEKRATSHIYVSVLLSHSAICIRCSRCRFFSLSIFLPAIRSLSLGKMSLSRSHVMSNVYVSEGASRWKNRNNRKAPRKFLKLVEEWLINDKIGHYLISLKWSCYIAS